ncbi:hypothetical protein BGX27_005008, partial [Mortierella sp. AM989]
MHIKKANNDSYNQRDTDGNIRDELEYTPQLSWDVVSIDGQNKLKRDTQDTA